jgi:hypothetical protein
LHKSPLPEEKQVENEVYADLHKWLRGDAHAAQSMSFAGIMGHVLLLRQDCLARPWSYASKIRPTYADIVRQKSSIKGTDTGV